MKPLNLVMSLGLALGTVVTAGCTSSRTVIDRKASTVELSVWQSAKKINVNEAVTFEATEANTLGRNAKLTWEATGGKIWPTDATNRIVQVQYTTPGVYSVIARLTAENQQPVSETRTVTVQPLTP